MAGPPGGVVDWELAARIGSRVAGSEPLAASYHLRTLESDLVELTAEAEQLVAEATGLVSSRGPARVRVCDRAAWIRANTVSFARLLAPFTDRVAASGPTPVTAVTRRLAGAEAGLLLGWMAGRVLGQYDMLPPGEVPVTAGTARPDPAQQDSAQPDPGGDEILYVAPNILALERRFGFPPRQFRLWLALHEVTHRAQFTGIDWLQPHFGRLLGEVLGAVDPDPARLVGALRRAARELAAGRNPLADGLVALLATGDQREALDRLAGLMSVLEGHGDRTMDRAGGRRIPAAERFGRALRARRSTGGPVSRFVRQVVGLEAKLAQYRDGEAFLAAVEAAAPDLVDAWQRSPADVPTLAEVRDPARWIARQRTGSAAAASHPG